MAPLDIDSPATVTTAVLMSCIGASMFLLEPLFLGAAADQLGFTGSQLGLLASIELTGAALASVAAVFWIRRLNWRVVAAVSLVAVAAGNLVSVGQTRFDVLVGIRFLTGLLGEGTAYSLGLALVGEMRQSDRKFGIVVAAQVALTVVAMLILPTFIAEHGIAAILLPLAVLAVLTLPGVTWLSSASLKVVALAEAGANPSSKPAVIALVVQFVWYVGIGAVWAFVERMGVAIGASALEIGSALALGTALGIGGALVAVLIGSRIGRTLMFTAAVGLQLLSLGGLAVAGSLPLFSVSIVVFQFGWNLALPYLLGAITSGDPSGQLTVLIVTAQGFGVALGPAVAGFLVEDAGLLAVVALCGACCLLAVFMFPWAARLLHVASASASDPVAAA